MADELDADSILIILSISLWVGAGSPKYSHLRTLSVIKKYAAFIEAANYTLSADDLINNFGTKPSDAPLYIEKMGGLEVMISNIFAVVDSEAYLPHPRNDGIVLPLFIALTAMTTIAIVLRMWSRYKVAGSIQSFDYITCAAFVSHPSGMLKHVART
ncbi:hypothetical protein TWF481_005039 [Arthrobotrys musiformis]|uniref:Uncharacterized protein n=1 Tax=Arthrobotrys musiformis TaxID=47236 RepID=A0AAV9WDH7_9PEZI